MQRERVVLHANREKRVRFIITRCVALNEPLRRGGVYFLWIYDNYKSSVWSLSERWSSPFERTKDIYCRKGWVQVDSNPLHIHAGLKSVASALSGGRRKKEQKENLTENLTERIPWLFMMRSGARNGNPGLFEQSKGKRVCARRGSLISLFVLLLTGFIGKTHFHANDIQWGGMRAGQRNERERERERIVLKIMTQNYYF